ncbi:hypothetical protein J9303_20890 [Bacillaceae bacterium Marseille-Q3522]|nr:hypothetical protein [Bacillaceae bacterium Marseille-Q3522]
MKIFFEELDGELQPKWLLIKPSRNNITFYPIDFPFERIDDLEDLRFMTIEMADLVKNPKNENQFGVNLLHVEKRLSRTGFHRSYLDEIDYFILLVDDVQEIMEYDLINLMNKRKTSCE